MPRLLIAATIPATIRGFLLPIARHFRRQGFRVDALAGPDPRGVLCGGEFDAVHTVSWSRNPLRPGLLLAATRIRALVAREQYDLVHVHTPVAGFVVRGALATLPRSQRPVVVYTAHGFHFHRGGSPVRNTAFAILEKLAGRWTDFLVVINHEDAVAARRLRLVPHDRIVAMPGIGVDPAHYDRNGVSAEQRAALRRELGLAPDEKYVLMVAEFNPGKRHADLLAAFARIAESPEAARVRVVLVGSGPLMDRMKQTAARLGLGGRVMFLGPRGDVPVLMSEATALVLPSDREGLPRSVLEAMCMGVPVVGSAARGTAQLLAGGAGYLFAVGDVPALAASLHEVLSRPREAAYVAAAALERVEQYSEARVVALHASLYARALAGRAAPGACSATATQTL